MVDEAQNKESMKGAIETLNQIASNNSTPKTIRKSISDLVGDLSKEEYSLSVRAANTISLLDDVTQRRSSGFGCQGGTPKKIT